jgi:hypothetical protein
MKPPLLLYAFVEQFNVYIYLLRKQQILRKELEVMTNTELLDRRELKSPQRSLEGTDVNHENSLRMVIAVTEIRTREMPNMPQATHVTFRLA